MVRLILTVSGFCFSASSLSAQMAPSSTGPRVVLELLTLAQTIVDKAGPLMVGIAVVVFFWQLVRFIRVGAENPSVRGEAIKGIWLSLFAIFVMVSLWGIIALLGSFFGISPDVRPSSIIEHQPTVSPPPQVGMPMFK